MADLGFREAFGAKGERYPANFRRGPWQVKRFTVSADEARFAALRASMRDGRYVAAGEYVGLWHDRRGVVMSATRDEMRDHFEPFFRAQRAGDNTTVLLAGFGLGMVAHGILQLPNVSHIDAIENDEDVLTIAETAFAPELSDGRLALHHGDAMTYQMPKGERWTVAWYDIWDAICTDNLSGMAKLKRRYARRAGWQRCWAERECRDAAKRSFHWR
jgi:hypothetical protein